MQSLNNMPALHYVCCPSQLYRYCKVWTMPPVLHYELYTYLASLPTKISLNVMRFSHSACQLLLVSKYRSPNVPDKNRFQLESFRRQILFVQHVLSTRTCWHMFPADFGCTRHVKKSFVEQETFAAGYVLLKSPWLKNYVLAYSCVYVIGDCSIKMYYNSFRGAEFVLHDIYAAKF